MLVVPLSTGSARQLWRRLQKPTRSVVRFREPGRDSAAPSTAPFDIIPKERNLEPVVQHPLLEKAEEDLERYCENLPDEDERRRCLRVRQYLQDQHEHFADGCKRELDQEGQPGRSCESLAKLEDMVRQVEGTKKELIKTIGVMERLNTREATGSCGALLSQDAKDTFEIVSHYDDLKQKAEDLFEKVDKNHDGRLDVAEFRDCIKLLSKELAGDEVMQIFTSLDAHGFITEEQFVDVVIAEKDRLENPHSDAELLRNLHVQSSWWSECPPSIDNL